MQIHTDLAPAGPYDDVVVLIDVLRTGTLAPMLLDLGLTRFALTASVRRARQEADADPALAEATLGIMKITLPESPREGFPFGPPVAPAPDAGPTERLVNWVGRASAPWSGRRG